MTTSVSIASVDPVLAPVDAAAGAAVAHADLESLHERASAVAGSPVEALALARELESTIPLPGDGAGTTERRWSALATLGAADLTVARSVEAHLDAVAILTEAERAGELHRSALPTGSWGVFAAESTGARLEASDAAPDARGAVGEHARVTLSGTKPWCSLAEHLDAALVTAWRGETRALFAVELRAPGVRLGEGGARWVSRGLRAVESSPVGFDRVAATPIGAPGWYVRRPGFAWGGIGVAAVWFGAAVAVARRLRPDRSRLLDDLDHLHLGEAERVLRPARALLAESARLIDEGDIDDGSTDAPQCLAWTVRAVVARAVDEIVTRVGRAAGPAPLAFDEEHARRVADLAVYVRQEHGERDAAALGASLAAMRAHPTEAEA